MTLLPCLSLWPSLISWLHILFSAYPHHSRQRWHLDRQFFFRENCSSTYGKITLSSLRLVCPPSVLSVLSVSLVSLMSVYVYVFVVSFLAHLVSHCTSFSACFCFIFEVYLHLCFLNAPPIISLFSPLIFLVFLSLCSVLHVNPWYQVVQQGRYCSF